MKRRFDSVTGRGLVWASWGELVLAIGCALSLLTGATGPAVGGFVVAGILGLFSAHRMWRGREEFGPTHEPLARRGLYLFLTAGGLFVAAALSLTTFNSPTHGFDPTDNSTVSSEEAHQFRDLYPPVFLFGLALTLEVLSGAHFLWVLCGSAWRNWVAAYAATGLAGAVWVLIVAWRSIRDLSSEAGGQAGSVTEARMYFDRFLDDVLPIALATLLLTRIAAYVLLRRAMDRVRQAESEAPAPSPPPASRMP